MTPFLDRAGVEEAYAEKTWQRVLFSEFAATLTSVTRPFPCIFGAAGFRTNQLRYAFLDPIDSSSLASILSVYLSQARSYGPNTSLVIMGRPGPVQPLSGYFEHFWEILRGLASVDEEPWPAQIPAEIDTAGWEFCFAGEPIFVVCNTPAHVLRQSRRASSFMLTFQPRWVFDKILGTEEAAKAAFGAVREHLERYDHLPVSPALGRYGDTSTREYAQYFLDEDNETAKCPFSTLHKISVARQQGNVAC